MFRVWMLSNLFRAQDRDSHGRDGGCQNTQCPISIWHRQITSLRVIWDLQGKVLFIPYIWFSQQWFRDRVQETALTAIQPFSQKE